MNLQGTYINRRRAIRIIGLGAGSVILGGCDSRLIQYTIEDFVLPQAGKNHRGRLHDKDLEQVKKAALKMKSRGLDNLSSRLQRTYRKSVKKNKKANTLFQKSTFPYEQTSTEIDETALNDLRAQLTDLGQLMIDTGMSSAIDSEIPPFIESIVYPSGDLELDSLIQESNYDQNLSQGLNLDGEQIDTLTLDLLNNWGSGATVLALDPYLRDEIVSLPEPEEFLLESNMMNEDNPSYKPEAFFAIALLLIRVASVAWGVANIASGIGTVAEGINEGNTGIHKVTTGGNKIVNGIGWVVGGIWGKKLVQTLMGLK